MRNGNKNLMDNGNHGFESDIEYLMKKTIRETLYSDTGVCIS